MKSFIEKLKENNIEVLLRSDSLEIVSYKESISEELLEEIRTHKDSIVQFLKSNSSDHIFKDINGNIHYKASYPQIEIWAACQDSKSSAAYHLPSFIQVEHTLDIETLRKALQFVVNKYEILRTNFTLSISGDLLQVIHPESSINVDVIDYRHANYEKGIAFINQDNLIRFDLEKDPLLRCFLIKLPGNQSLFYYNIHHIISDEWSGKIFENEVFIAYDAFLNESESKLENTPYRYRDYIDWYQTQLNKTDHHKQYWKDILSPLPDVLQLPTSKPYPSFRTYDSISARMFLSEYETNLLQKLSQKLQGSLFTGVLTILKVLIYKYTNNDDLIIGSHMATRERAEFDKQIGYFLKTLILRNTVSETDSFNSLFNRIKKNLIPAYEHSIYPLSEILKDINFKRDQSRSSVFNISITFHDERKDPHLTQEIYTNIIEEAESTCKYDIEFHFGVVNSQLYIRANYNTEIYEPHIIHSFIRHYRELILKFSQAPDISISEIDYLVDGERKKILKLFNRTSASYPEEKTLVNLFEEQVEKTPDNVAVFYEGRELNYSELNSVSNQLGHYLRDQYAIQADDLICIKLPRSERMIISILGILKSGGAYVPIDIDYPQERIDYILKDTGAKVVIDESFLSDFEKVKDDYSAINPDCAAKPDNLAYIIYTSGTTGNPKGVMITHSNLMNYVCWSNGFYFKENDRGNWGLFTSISFDLSGTAVFCSLSRGSKLWLGSSQDNSLQSLLNALGNEEIDILKLTPSHISLLRHAAISSTGIRKIILGGEKLYKEHINIIQSISDNIEIYDEYGPTEATIGCIAHKTDGSAASIGKPISNTQVYILDDHHQLVPEAVIGELYIAGAGLARGYLNRSDLTEEKFIPNPFVAGTKMYRTGDLGRWLPDGRIEYMGRIDHQVKIRGHRVELGEIESHALSYSNSIRSVVAEVKEHQGDKSLVVYYVSDSLIDKQKLSQYLETKLPQYMLPGFYVELESIPLTGNGKVDRKNLPEVSLADLIKNEYVAPVTEEQRILVEVCEQVLKHSPISIRDNYYNLGGDSIKSIQIVSRLRLYGYSLKVEYILQYPLLEELARHMTTDVVEIDQSVVTGDSILTPIQKSFFENEDIHNKNYYNQSVILKSQERLSGAALELSLQKLVDHHDALRMVYTNKEGMWRQFNSDTSRKHYRLEYFDLRTSTSESEELESLQKIGDALQSSIDITSGIIFHVGHVSLRDGDRLILILHHLVVDGVSWRILLEDLGNLYGSEIKGEPYSLPAKTDSFQTWGRTLEEYSKSQALLKERRYWESIESGDYSVPEPDYLVNGKQIPDKNIRFTLTAEETRLLKTRAGRKYGAEINDLLLTGLALSLREQFGISKTRVMMEGHGREAVSPNINISRTVGWFTSVFPFSLDISNAEQPELVSIKEGLRRIPDKGIGYGVLHYLDKRISSAEIPPIQFNYLGDFDDIGNGTIENNASAFQYSSENIGAAVPAENMSSNILLDVSGMTVHGTMNIDIRYSDKIFTESTLKKLTESYQRHLRILIMEHGEERILTPSDLTYKGLSFKTISDLNRGNTVEDIYELSPMQQGLYYHWFVDPKGSAYFMQASYRIKSPNLDLSLVEKAFGILVNRYTILRTSFDNRYGNVPLQIVHKKARVDFKHFILESAADLDDIRQGDIMRGFNLNEPTQMRLMVVELPDGAFEFIWSHHHIIMDGWCLAILINDFSIILSSLQQRIEINLPEPHRYSSYIKWLARIDKEEAMAYWENYLKGINAPSPLPFEKQVKEETPRFIAEKFIIGKEEFLSVNQFCKHLGITLNTYAQAIWSYLLSSYNGTEDVVFGAVVSGRPPEIEGIENMVGLFINTIPVHIKVSKEDTPRSLLEKVHQDSIQSTGYHFNSLAQIQLLSPLGKDLIKNIIVFENYLKNEEANAESSSTAGLASENVESFDHSNYDFNFVVTPDKDCLHIEFRYNSSVFYSEGVTNLVSHFKKVLSHFITSADISLSEINYLVDGEREKILKSFNNTSTSYPEEKTLVNLFEEQVEKTPDNAAVFYEGTELNYAELNALSNQLGHYLRDQYAIQSDDLICIKLPRSERMIISILGILKSGGAYVPIDIDYPQERIDYILKDTGAKVVIDESLFSDFEKVKDNYSAINLDCVTKPDNLAYIIYTSGTTGNPKGVMIENRSVINLISAQSHQFQIDDKERILQFSNYAFDASVEQIFLALLNGAALYLISKVQLIDYHSLTVFLKENKITHFHAVPAVIREVKPDEGFSLKRVIAGGDVCSRELAESWSSICRFYNEYGPTETTVTSVELRFDKECHFSIGRPISNTQVYILDDHHQPIPEGVIGELYIAGAGLARGYLNLSDLTEEKFISNPFVAGTKMYRTGDLGRWLPDGSIEYLGRIDHQVKIRGYRIELGEIESHILSYSNSIRSVVVEVKEYEGEKNLVAYYVSDSMIDKQKLSQYLETKLPQYMLPGFYVELESIPLTHNGKVDRKNLPDVLSKDLIKNEYVAPVTEEQRILVEVCEQVLNQKSISIKDNFYNLGGDSIKSIQIVSKLRKYGYTLKVMHILQHPVLEELSDFITAHVIPVDQSAVAGNVVLTPIQKHFFENNEIVNKNYYNQSILLKSDDRLSGSVINSSVERLVNHHDALRMVYTNEEGKWSQFNADTSAKHYRYEYFDLRTGMSESEELEGLQKIGEELQSSIDITSGILFHVGHVSMRDGDRLILILHHLVVDGVSWRILLEDLNNLYHSGISGTHYNFPAKTHSFQKWGHVLQEYSTSKSLSEENEYWNSIESEMYPAISTDYNYSGEGKYTLNRNAGFSLNEESTKLLYTKAGKKYGAEINDLLLAGLALSLKVQFGITKTKILMEGHGREEISSGTDISRTIGWFTSMYPFSLDISNESRPVIESVKESLRRIPKKGIGYGVLYYLTKSIISGSKALIQFNYLGDFNDIKANDAEKNISHFQLSSENIGQAVPSENLSTDILIDISGMTVNGVMNINFRYSDEVFTPESIEKLCALFERNIKNIVNESENKDWAYGDAIPVSPNQYYLFRNPYSSVSFNIKIDQFNDKHFENKLRKSISSFPFLMTKYEKEGDFYIQRYLSEKEIVIKIRTENIQKKSEKEIERIGKKMMLSPYNVLDGELIRVFIIKTEDKDPCIASVFFGLHHSLSDDYTAKYLKKALENYFNTGSDIAVHPHHFNFIDSQESFLKSHEGLTLKDKQIQEILKTPLYHHSTKEVSDIVYYQNFTIKEFFITGEDFAIFQKISQKTLLPFNAFCLSIFLKLINSYNDQSRRFYGVTSNNRENSEYEKILGVLTNLIILSYPDFNTYSIPEILKNYGEMIEARTTQKIPYEVIRKEIQVMKNKELESNILGIYNYFNQSGEAKEHKGFIEYEMPITDFDGLNFKVFEYSNGVLLHLSYPISGKAINFSEYIQEFLNFIKTQ
ncbi:amino acid adenylation domain-containing protein [Chryseobacterium sp.]|uniref:amino acid adenylation domain-containing protein n=2 Tax=Chryseobacterium sp. TaxID=1871047 RepID=UPI0035C69C91